MDEADELEEVEDEDGENEELELELELDKALLVESRDDTDKTDCGPWGESILITGGVTHPEFIAWLDCGRVLSCSSSESDNVKSITSILDFFGGEEVTSSPSAR